MKPYRNDCPFCRLMRSFAFTGIAMALGAGVAYLVGANREQMAYAGIVIATLVVFGIMGRQARR